LGVMLGLVHPITVAYTKFWQLLTRGLRNEVQYLIDNTGRIKPAHLLRSIQLLCYSWFTHRRACLDPPQVDFADILHKITLQAYTIPHLPPALFKLAYGIQQNPKHISSTGTTTTLTTTPTTTITAGGTDTISAITTPSALTRAGTLATSRGTFQANLTPDVTLQNLIPANLKLRDIIGTAQQPLTDDGKPICISFHMRQGCWSNCKRLDSHNKPLTASEKQRLEAFVMAQLAAKTTVPRTPPAP
jgi:hypothetical protein